MSETRTILGVDPGTVFTGYGVIKISGKSPIVENIGYIDLSKISDHYLKLRMIFNRMVNIIEGGIRYVYSQYIDFINIVQSIK